MSARPPEPRPRPPWRRPERAPGLAGLILLAVLILPCPGIPDARAADPPGRLEEVERQRKESEAQRQALREEAERLAREAQELSEKLVALAAAARAHEQAITDLGHRLTEIAAEEEARRQGLSEKRARLAQLLAALERIARHPPEALIAYARTPQDTLRGAMLLRAAIPELETEARALKAELAALAGLGEQAVARAEALRRERAALEEKRKELAALVQQKRALARTTRAEEEAAAARAARLAREAKDLRELLARIERERAALAALRPKPAPPPAARPGDQVTLRPPAALRGLPQSITKARGKLAQPVIGRLAVAFGDRDETEIGTTKGIRLETAAGAQVVAPFGGEVVFAGPFRGYGPLLIIDHGEGYHSLLAGLGRIDAVVGQNLLAGEPVGIMPRPGTDSPRLYMELRQGGRPIDPLPWLAAPPNSKVSG